MEIPHIRFDGTVSAKKRDSDLANFCGDDDIRVALLTVSCGAVGYESQNGCAIQLY